MRPACVLAVSQAAGREITAQEAQGLEGRLRENLRMLARIDREKFLATPVDERLRAASQLTAQQILGEAAEKKRRLLLSTQRQAALDGYIENAKKTGLDGLDALKRTLVFESDGKSNFLSVESRVEAVRADGLRQLWDTFDAADSRIFGLMANPEGIRALTKELFREATGSELAKKGAEAFRKVAEQLRQRFNAAGGTIPAREDWNIPQHHDQAKVFAAGREQWIRDTLPKLNRDQYVNEAGRLMTDAEVTDFLQHAYQSIATGGLNKIEPGQRTGSGMMANRGDEARQIHFKSADDYLDYQTKYGASTLEQVIAKHVGKIARDIALVETYGPNPDQVFGLIRDREAKAIAESGSKSVGKVPAQMDKLDNLFNYVAGRHDPIASQFLARGLDGLRQWLIGSRLGSSTITALVDEATLHLTAHVNNLPQMQLVRNELATFNPADRAEARILRRAGLGIESLTSELNRWGNDNLGRSFASRVAETTMRLSGLDALDSARRRAFGATFFDWVGGRTREHEHLADIPKEDAGLLQKKGISETDWQVWRKAQTEDWGNGNDHVLSPDAIMRVPDAELAGLVEQLHGPAEATDALAGHAQQLREEALTKLLGIVLEEGKMVVPGPGVQERVIAGAGMQRGTLSGELWRTLLLFKSFPLAMIRKHFMRGMGMPTAGGRAGYIASLVAGTTIFGALAVEINNILSGKDPQKFAGTNQKPWEIQKNWVAAFLKGGSMGIYGDFLFSSVSKNGQNDLFGSLAGPGLGLAQEAMNVTQGNAIQWGEGKTTNAGAEATKMLKGLAPGASLWYAKAALDHLLFQQVAEYLSPGYLGRMQSAAQSQFNEKFWWKPGSGPAGARAPDLGRAIGQP